MYYYTTLGVIPWVQVKALNEKESQAWLYIKVIELLGNNSADSNKRIAKTIEALEQKRNEFLQELEPRRPIKYRILATVQDLGDRIINNTNVFLIPSDDGLESANYKLASSGLSLFILRNRLQPIVSNFGVAIVDPPPERSHLAQTSLGAGDRWVIPAESNVKGVQSLLRTMELIKEFKAALPYGELLGVVPFRARWTGLHPTNATKTSIDTIRQLVGSELMLPHILESDVFKNAINQRVAPTDLGQPNLEYAIHVLAQRLKPALSEEYAKLIPLEPA